MKMLELKQSIANIFIGTPIYENAMCVFCSWVEEIMRTLQSEIELDCLAMQYCDTGEECKSTLDDCDILAGWEKEIDNADVSELLNRITNPSGEQLFIGIIEILKKEIVQDRWTTYYARLMALRDNLADLCDLGNTDSIELGLFYFPRRKVLDHRGPLSIDVNDDISSVTLEVNTHREKILTDCAMQQILKAARYYQKRNRWFIYLFMVLPKKIQMIVHVPMADSRIKGFKIRGHSIVVPEFKAYLTNRYGIFFENNIVHLPLWNRQSGCEIPLCDKRRLISEWNCICRSPVVEGLVSKPNEWAYCLAFNRLTGEELRHL